MFRNKGILPTGVISFGSGINSCQNGFPGFIGKKIKMIKALYLNFNHKKIMQEVAHEVHVVCNFQLNKVLNINI